MKDHTAGGPQARERDRSYGNNKPPNPNKPHNKFPDHRDGNKQKPFTRDNQSSDRRDHRSFDRQGDHTNSRPRRSGGFGNQDKPHFSRDRQNDHQDNYNSRSYNANNNSKNNARPFKASFNHHKHNNDEDVPTSDFTTRKPHAVSQSFDEYHEKLEQEREKELHREKNAQLKAAYDAEKRSAIAAKIAPSQPILDPTPAQLREFKAQHDKNQALIAKVKYAPFIGVPEKIPAYKPFINAAHNVGGISHLQLYQLHLYTQCLLASQRHKLDLDSFNDGYYNNAIFPPVPEYFPYLNVTALRRPDLIFNQHLADALSLIPTIEAHIPSISTETVTSGLSQGLAVDTVPIKIVDVGAGGGIPSVILAIMRPSWQITAIDTIAKKCNFLRHTADRLGLSNFTVISGSSSIYANPRSPTLATPLKSIPQYANQLAIEREEAPFSMYEAYDICVARGVTQMPQLLPICMPLVRPGGKFIAMKSLLSSLPKEQRDEMIESVTGSTDGKKSSILAFLRDSNENGLEVDDELLKQVETSASHEVAQDEQDQSKKRPDRGQTFKSAQADHVKNMSNFESLLSNVLSQAWIPAGRTNQNYLDLSIELNESFPTLGKYGASKKQAVFVHTDLFFQINGNESKFAKVVEEQKKLKTQFAKQSVADAMGVDNKDDDETDDTSDPKTPADLLLPSLNQVGFTQDKITDEQTVQSISKQYFPSQEEAFKTIAEGKVGETAKYLVVIDKIRALPIDTEEESKPSSKPLSKQQEKKQKLRASAKFQFQDPLGEGQSSEIIKPKSFYNSLEGDEISFSSRKYSSDKPAFKSFDNSKTHIHSSGGDKRFSRDNKKF